MNPFEWTWNIHKAFYKGLWESILFSKLRVSTPFIHKKFNEKVVIEVHSSNGIGSVRNRSESITSLVYRWAIQEQDYHKNIIKIRSTFHNKQISE